MTNDFEVTLHLRVKKTANPADWDWEELLFIDVNESVEVVKIQQIRSNVSPEVEDWLPEIEESVDNDVV